MLRAKAWRFKQRGYQMAGPADHQHRPGFPCVVGAGQSAQAANAAARSKPLRKVGERVAGIHRDAPLPVFTSKLAIETHWCHRGRGSHRRCRPTGRQARWPSTSPVNGDHNTPEVVEDLIGVLNHNDVPVTLLKDAKCCGMPKLELGDLDRVAALKDANLPTFLEAIDAGPRHPGTGAFLCIDVQTGTAADVSPTTRRLPGWRRTSFDPFEYLMLRHKAGLVKTDFKKPLGKVAYHVACHQRVQNIGMKTRDFLNLIDGTEVAAIERCSGHDGTYAVKAENPCQGHEDRTAGGETGCDRPSPTGSVPTAPWPAV